MNIQQLAFEYSDLNRTFWAVESNGGCNQTRGANLHSFALGVFLKRNFAVEAIGGAEKIPKNPQRTIKNLQIYQKDPRDGDGLGNSSLMKPPFLNRNAKNLKRIRRI